MRLLKLEVEGYRSLHKVVWTPGALNVVIGPNGSGKSNLLKVLELFAVSARGGLSRYVQKEGGMEPLLWDGKPDFLQITAKTSAPDIAEDGPNSLEYRLVLGRLGGTSAYQIQTEHLGGYYILGTSEKPTRLKVLDRSPFDARIFDEEQRELAPADTVPEEETLLSIAVGPFTLNRVLSGFQRELSGWTVYHGLDTSRDAAIRQPVVTRNETRVSSDGQNLISVLHTLYTGNREFKRELNAAMQAAFGQDFEELVFPPAADQRIQLRVRWKSLEREQSAADLSDGTLRFLFLLAVLANPAPPSLIAIDEPETGLHPAMLPLIAEYAVDASSRTQVIFTTHSPEFLDAFRGTRPTTTVVQWADGKTELRVLEAAALDYWLQRYTLGELQRSGELEAMG